MDGYISEEQIPALNMAFFDATADCMAFPDDGNSQGIDFITFNLRPVGIFMCSFHFVISVLPQGMVLEFKLGQMMVIYRKNRCQPSAGKCCQHDFTDATIALSHQALSLLMLN